MFFPMTMRVADAESDIYVFQSVITNDAASIG